MKYKEVALTVAVLMTSGTLVAAKDSHLEWISRDGRMYWLENGEIQGVTGDPKNIIDEIYLSKKLLIVTTNLKPLEMKCADTIERKRIYERILEMCGTKVLVDNDKTRLQSGIEKGKIAESILNS